jgi:hypothetical protein
MVLAIITDKRSEGVTRRNTSNRPTSAACVLQYSSLTNQNREQFTCC